MNSGQTDKLIETIASHFLHYRSLKFETLLSVSFLCDWKHEIEFDRTISGCSWEISDNRVRSVSFEKAIRRHASLAVESDAFQTNVGPKRKLRQCFLHGSTEKRVCDHVFSATNQQSDFNIARLVLSTFPFNYYGKLDLSSIKSEYIKLFGREYLFLNSA